MTRISLASVVFGTVLALSAIPGSAAVVTTNLGAYSVTYDNSTSFGAVSAGPGVVAAVSFQFSVPPAINVIGNQVAAFLLPEFTVSVNAGYVLSGAVAGLIGNLAYLEFPGGQTLASVSGNLSVDGSAPIVFSNVLLSKIETSNNAGAVGGYYVGSAGVQFGAFSSLQFSAGTLNLASAGPAGIVSNQQNIFNISFSAVPVPEPESYAMLLAGLGLLGAVVRRRARQI